MSMGNAAETAWLTLLFNNDAWADIGDASGLQPSGADGVFYIALHTADPGEAGDQTTSEADYTGYARISVARTSGGFTVAGNQVSNTAEAAFAACTGGDNDITHFSFGTEASGASIIVGSAVVTVERNVVDGITPRFPATTLVVTAD